MHTVFALLCFVVVIHRLIFPYPSGLLHWHCGNLTIAPVPAKQPWWIWINTSCEFIMNDCITTTKQSTAKSCAYFLGYTVWLGYQLKAIELIKIIDKYIARHTAHTIVSWPDPKQWIIVNTSDLMRMIRQSIYIFSIITREMGKLKHTAPYIVWWITERICLILLTHSTKYI